MLDVTNDLHKYDKRIAKFKKLQRVQDLLNTGQATITTEQGRTGCTRISDNLVKEFYLWLSEETRQQVLDGVR